MKTLSILISILLLSSFGAQQKKRIYGVITEQTTQEPMVYVKVIFSNSDATFGGVYCDLDGFFSSETTEDSVQLTLISLGYDTVVTPFYKLPLDSAIKISMTPSTIEELPPIIIKHSGPE